MLDLPLAAFAAHAQAVITFYMEQSCCMEYMTIYGTCSYSDTTPPHSHGLSNGESVGVNGVYNPTTTWPQSAALVQCRSGMGPGFLSWGPEFNTQVLQARLSVVRKLSTKFWWLPTKKRGHFELKTPPQGRQGPCWIAELKFWPRGSSSIFGGELKYFFGEA